MRKHNEGLTERQRLRWYTKEETEALNKKEAATIPAWCGLCAKRVWAYKVWNSNFLKIHANGGGHQDARCKAIAANQTEASGSTRGRPSKGPKRGRRLLARNADSGDDEGDDEADEDAVEVGASASRCEVCNGYDSSKDLDKLYPVKAGDCIQSKISTPLYIYIYIQGEIEFCVANKFGITLRANNCASIIT